LSKDVFDDVQRDIDGVKLNMNKTIKNMLEDHQNLEELLVKSKGLEDNTQAFQKNSSDLKNKTTSCMRTCLIYSSIFILVCFIVYIVFALVRCGSLNIVCSSNN